MSTDCPNRTQLTQFALATLPSSDQEWMIEHVEHCPLCQAELNTIDLSADTLVASLRAPTAREVDDSTVARLVALVEAVGREPSFAGRRAATDSAPPSLGTIRDYRLLAKLGEGGMGAVYKALHTRLEKVVALKVLPAERMNAAAVARFEREMRAVGKLQHPNIVGAHDAGEHEGRHFLVMEYVAGHDLSEIVRHQGPLAIADACEIVRQAAVGLQHAHQHGLVHRDIKPSNLMLAVSPGVDDTLRESVDRSRSERTTLVKILDLGLALLAESPKAGGELTGTAQMMGTADYMAPEQVDDSHRVDIRADIYSLGCTLYKLLTGEAPFSGPEFNTPIKKMMAHVGRTAPPVAARRSDIPPELAALLDRLLAKSPADRPGTPAEVAAALAPFCGAADLAALASDQPLAGELVRRVSASDDPSASAPTEPHLSSALTGTATEQPLDGELVRRATAPDEPSPLAGAPAETDETPSVVARRASSRARWSIPPRYRLPAAIAAAAGFLFIALGIWIIIRDRQGNEVARFKVPDGGSFTAGDNIDTDPSDNAVDPLGDAGASKSSLPLPSVGEGRGEGDGDDREVAHWALSAGARLEVFVGDKYLELEGDATKLPDEGDVRIQAIEFAAGDTAAGNTVTDADLARLTGLPGLKTLGCYGLPLTDAAGPVLANLPGLEQLSLGQTRITDAILSELANLSNLTSLRLGETAITADGVQKLHAALPNCKIESDHGTFGPADAPPAVAAAAPQWPAEERHFAPGEPLSSLALVRRPAAIDGVKSWTLETVRHRGPIRAVAYSHDDKYFATAGDDGVVRIWNAETGELLRGLVAGIHFAWSLDWSPGDYRLAVGAGGGRNLCTVWDAESGRMLWRSALPVDVGTSAMVAWSPDGNMIAFPTFEDSVAYIDVRESANGELIQRLPTPWGGGTAWCINWSPDGAMLMACEAEAYVWDVRTWSLKYKLPAEVGKYYRWIAATPDGSQVVTYRGAPYIYAGGAQEVEVREIESGGSVASWTVGCADGIRFASDGTLLANAHEYYTIFDPAGQEKIATIPIPPTHGILNEALHSSAWRHDGTQALLGMHDGTWSIWDKGRREVVRRSLPSQPRRDGPSIYARVTTPDGHSGVGAFDQLFPEQPFSGRIDWSADRRSFVQAQGTEAIVWDAAAATVLRRLGHDATVVLAAMSPDGRNVAAADQAGVVRLWSFEAANAAALTIEAAPGPKGLLEILPDGHNVLVAGSTFSELWGVEGGQRQDVYDHGVPPLPAAGTPAVGSRSHVWLDDNTFVMRCHDNALRVFDCRERAFTHEVKDVATTGRFSHDGRRYVWFDPAGCPHEMDVLTGATRELAVGIEVAQSSPLAPREERGPVADSGRVAPQPETAAETGSVGHTGWVAISPEGHYGASDGFDAEAELVYVVETDRGQETLSPSEFARRFGWKSDPAQVQALDLAWPESGPVAEGDPDAPQVEPAAANANASAPPGNVADDSTAPSPPTPLPRRGEGRHDAPEAQAAAMRIEPQPFQFTPGAAVSADALVAKPAALPGLASWTLDTLPGREAPWEVKYSPDGRWFVPTAEWYGLTMAGLTIWDAHQRRPLRRLQPAHPVFQVRWSPNGRYLACTHDTGPVLTIWDVESGRQVRAIELSPKPFPRMAWLADGRTIVCASYPDNYALKVDVASGSLVDVIEQPGQVWCAEPSGSGSYLAACPVNRGRCSVWHVPTRRLVRSLPMEDYGRPAGWLHDEESLIASFFGVLTHWQMGRITPSAITNVAPQSSVSISPDDRFMAHRDGRSSAKVHLVELPSLRPLRELSVYGGAKAAGEARGGASWSPDGRMLVCGSSTDGLIFWRPTAATPLDVVDGIRNQRNSTAGEFITSWSPDGMHITPGGGVGAVPLNHLALRSAGWSADGTSLAWSSGRDVVVRNIPSGEELAVAFNPQCFHLFSDGSLIAILTDEGHTEIRGVRTKELHATLDHPPFSYIFNLACSPNGARVGLSTTAGVQLFSSETGALEATLRPSNLVQLDPLSFSRDGRLLATTPERIASFNEFPLEIWDIENRRVLMSIDAHAVPYRDGVTWLPDGNTVAVKCTGNRLRMFDARTGQLVRELTGISTNGVFNRDASRFITPVDGDALRVYSTATGELEYTIVYLRDDNWIVVSPEGHYRASPGAEQWLCYVAMGEDGSQQTLTPAEFQERYGWMNDPATTPNFDE